MKNNFQTSYTGESIPIAENKGDGVTFYNSNKIYSETLNFLTELSSASLTFPLLTEIKIIDRLKEIERNGKKLRLANFSIKDLKARSIYDHILSVAHLADALVSLDKNQLIKDDNISELGRLIAYHEVNEVLLGDIPAYTVSTDIVKDALPNEEKLRNIDKLKREKTTNKFIWLFLNKKQRESINALDNNLTYQKRDVMRFFRMLDQLDPIVAIWRYLHYYRKELKGNVQKFIDKMNDFFVNPNTLEYKNSTSKIFIQDFGYLKGIMSVLTNKVCALYYGNGASMQEICKNKKESEVLQYLIERVELFTIT